MLCFVFNVLNLLCGFSSRESGDILLKICNLMPQDTGIYTCTAINDHGTASSSASIKVQGNAQKGNVQQKRVLYIFCLLCLLIKDGGGRGTNHCVIDVFCVFAHVKASQQPPLDP